jgi:hypothetical protein
MKDTVYVGLPNEMPIEFSLDIVMKWQPTEVRYVHNKVFFKNKDSYMSMEKLDFIDIFGDMLPPK